MSDITNGKMAQVDLSAKLRSLAQASADKAARLRAISENDAEVHAQIQQQRKLRDASWAGLAGLDEGGFAANRVNDAASLFSGATRMAGDILTLPMNLAAAGETAGATEEEYAAYNRVQAGSTDPYDLKVAKQFQNAEHLRGMAKSVKSTLDFTGAVDPTNRQALSNDLGDDFEANWGKVTAGWKDGKPGSIASGIAGLLLNAGEAVVTNPSAAREYILENAPQLFTGALGVGGKVALAASNIGYAADYYRQGLEAYAAKNGGALPPEEERTKRAIYAATLAGAEQVGDMVGLGMAKLGGKAVGDAAKTGALQSLKNTLKAGATAGAGEALTEGYQTFAEGEVLGTPATAEGIYEGAVIGGVAGAGLSGGARGIAEVMKATPEHAKERAVEEENTANFDKAVADKTPEVFLNEESPDYNPAKAVAVIHEIAKQEADPEQVKTRLSEATAIIDDLEKQKNKLEQTQAESTPEYIEQLKQEVAELEEVVPLLDKDDPDLAELQEGLVQSKTQLEALTDEGQVLRRKNSITALSRQLDEARESHTALYRMANPLPSKEEVDTTIEQANSTDKAVSSKAVQTLLNLSMAAPDDLDPTKIKNLVNNASNGLTSDQRDLLRKFSDARTAELQLKKQSDVSQEILFGQKQQGGNIGIAQYRTRIAAAVQAGNLEVAKRDLSMLGNFAQNHIDKLRTIAAAEVGDQVVYNKEAKKWEVNTGKRLSDKERRQNGAVNINANSTKLIEEIRNEAKALRAVHIQMTAAVALKFGKAAVQSVPSPAATTVPQNKSMKKSVEGETRPSVPEGRNVAGEPQKKTLEEKKAAAKAAIEKKRGPVKPAAASPQSQPSVPVAATAAPDTVAQSAPATKSVLVDKQGKPVIVYHGSANKLPAQLRSGEPIYVTTAQGYAESFNPLGEGETAAFTADIRNPYYATEQGEIDGIKYSKEALAKLKEQGYDGVIYEGKKGPQQALVFDASQLTRVLASAAQPANEAAKNPISPNENEAANFNDEWAKALAEMDELAASEQPAGAVATATAAEDATAAEQAPAGPLMAGLKLFGKKLAKLPGKMHDVFNDINPVAQFIEQDPISEMYLTQRPLVAVQDFLSAWSRDRGLVNRFIENGDNLTENQHDALLHMARSIVKFNNKLKDNFRKYDGDKNFINRDMMQHLYVTNEDDSLDVEENIKTAISAAVYQWLLSEANSPATITDEQLNKRHGMPKGTLVDPKGGAILRRFSGMDYAVIHEIGTAAINALGFKAGPDAPADLLPKLVNALGTHGMMMMQETGFIERVEMPVDEVNSYFGDGLVVTDDQTSGETDGDTPGMTKKGAKVSTMTFVKVVRQEGDKLTDQMSRIRQANVKTGGIIEKLFGTDRVPTTASNTPLEFNQKLAKNSGQEIPEMQVKASAFTAKIPHKAIGGMFRLFDVLGKEAVLRVAGFVNIEDDRHHIDNHDSMQAQNDNLENQYDRMMELRDEPSEDEFEDREWYILPEVWKNFRAGIATRSLNPQTSKIHRVAFSRPGWSTTIKFSDQAMLDEFLVGVAMQLGIKTDQKLNTATLEEFDKKFVQNEKFQKVIGLIRDLVIKGENRDITSGEVDQIIDMAGEGMLSLQALMEYANFTYAQEQFAQGKGKAEFTTQLLVGADGKTSGPMLTHLALGAAEDIESMKTLMARGAFYTEGDDQPKHYSEYASQGNEDLYQDLSGQVTDESLSRIRDKDTISQMWKAALALPEGSDARKAAIEEVAILFTQKDYDAVQAITKTLRDDLNKVTSAGRNLVKTPLTGFMFGSALKAAINMMADKFIADVVNNIEDMATGKRKSSELGLQAYLQQVDALIKMSQRKDQAKVPLFSPAIMNVAPEHRLEAALRTSLTKEQKDAIRKAFIKVIGDPAKATMNDYFGVMIKRRRTLNTTLQAGYHLSEAVFAEAKEQEMVRLMESGDVAWRKENKSGKKVPKHELPMKIMSRLRKKLKGVAPVAHSAMSVQEGNLNAGLYMAKSGNEVSESPLYANQVLVNTKTELYNEKGKFSQIVHSQSYVRGNASPGVAGTSYGIHSADSAGMTMAINAVPEAQILNIHDEEATGVGHIRKSAQAINKSITETMLAYSPAREAVNMIERQTTELIKLVQTGKLNKVAVARTLEAWANLYNQGKPMEFWIDADQAAQKIIEAAVTNAYEADKMRLTFLSQLGAVDQYSWEGGQFTDLETIREQAKKELAALEEGMPHELEVNIHLLNTMLGDVQGTEQKQYADWVMANVELAEEGTFDNEVIITPESTLSRHTILMDSMMESVKARFPSFTGLKNAKVKGKKRTNVEAINAMPEDERAVAIQMLARTFSKIPQRLLSPFGERGVSTVAHDMKMVEAFEKNPVMNRDQFLDVLRDSLMRTPENTDIAKINGVLFRELLKLVPKDLKVRYITPTTSQFDVLAMAKQNSRGWFVSDPWAKDGKGASEIYVLSTDHLHSGVTAELMLHELLHAVLANRIQNPEGDVAKLVAELESLRQVALKSPNAAKYADALSSVHEMVSWGMTNADFQNDVLKTIKVKNTSAKNSFVTGMKTFIKAIYGILFPERKHERMVSGLELLVQNTAGLLKSVEEQPSEMKWHINQSMTSTKAETYSTKDVYNELGQNNPLAPEDDARLRGLLDSIVEVMAPVYGVLGQEAMTSTLSAQSLWANAVAGGQAPFANDAVAAGFASNEQVAFVLEQTEAILRAAFNGADGRTSVAYTETVKLYEEARKALDGKLDPKLYDFLFSIENKDDGSSDYLSRFAAMALVHPDVNKALAFETDKGTKKEKATSFLGRLQDAFEKVLAWVVGRWTRTYAGQQADQKLDALATQLVKIEATRRARLNMERSKTLESIEDAFRSVADKARDKVDDLATSDFFKQSKNGFVRFAGSMTSTYVKDRMDQFMQAYEDFSNKHFHYSQGMFSGLVTELRGSNKGNVVFYKLLRMAKFLEGKRKDMITGTAKVVLHSFANKGKDLTDSHKESISNVFLRTDMAALLDRFDMKGLRELVANPAALAKAIVDVTAELGKPRHQMFYINAAKALGYQMVSGEVRTANNLMNAHNIARLYGTNRTSEVQQNVIDKTEPLIDLLASLYALQYTKAEHKADAVKVLDIEMAREGEDKGNGVEMVLRMHKQLQKESKDRLFKDQPALMMKGYTPEIYNPYIEVQVVDPSEVDTLKQQGFGKPMPLPLADADPERNAKVLMARHGTGLQQHTTGTMSLTSMSTKGTTKHNGVLDLFSDQGQYNQGMMLNIARDAAKDIEAMFHHPMEPAAEKRTFLAPVLNPQGKVVNYRYMMNNVTKKEVLNRDNRFDKLLGTMAGSIFDKQSTPKQNETVVKALHEQYKLEGAKRPKSFINVGPNSPDPEMREIYRLLPEATKQAIREVWKTDSMMVRIDLLDMNFGYRKLSMSDVLKKDRELRTGMDKFFGEVLGFIFSGGKILGQGADPKDVKARDAIATMRIRQFEEGWQAVVREIKDTLVVKSISTFMGNMQSNITLLYAYGVPMTDILRHHRIAFRGAVAYKRDSDELFALQAKLDTGMSGNINEDKKRVAQLKDALAKNPVRELIEAGLMPTIVEDVELDDDIYSFKSRMMTKLEDKTKWINKDVKNVGKQLYMAHDTAVYKALSQAAQLSDFLGRYTLYQHMTTRKRDPMGKEEAMQLASDAFINYDVPTHRKMQYMNEMGFFRFTKYYLRIQKVIMHLYRDNPGRMVALMGMEWYFSSVSSVLDSSIMRRFGNPLENGAFDAPKAFTELSTVKALAIPFK